MALLVSYKLADEMIANGNVFRLRVKLGCIY